MPGNIQLREVYRSDLDIFFEHQLDEEANRMAAFTSKDPSNREEFNTKWDMIFSDETITKRTIVVDGKIVGYVLKYVGDELRRPEITYWVAKSDWGKGFATSAVRNFLELVSERPIFARAAADNKASIRVLEKCGFEILGHDTGFANARGETIDELVLRKTVN